MDALAGDGPGNHRVAVTEEFLRTEEISGVVSCSLPNSVSQVRTHHSHGFWYIMYQWATDSYICLVSGLGVPSQARRRDRTLSRN